MPVFRLLAGNHIDSDPFHLECNICHHRWKAAKKMVRENCPECAKVGEPAKRPASDTRFSDKRYFAGDVFETKCDLTRKNAPGFPPKFELCPAGTPLRSAADAPPEEVKTNPYQAGNSYEDTLRAMTVDELKKEAAAEEIDLSKCKGKDEMVRTMIASLVKT